MGLTALKNFINSIRARYRRLSIATRLSLIFTLSILLTVTAIGAFATQAIFEATYNETISKLTINAEQVGSEIKKNLENSLRRGRFIGDDKRKPDHLLKVEKDGSLSSVWRDNFLIANLRNFRVDLDSLVKHENSIVVVQNSGTNYIVSLVNFRNSWARNLANKNENYIALWDFPEDINEIFEKNSLTKTAILYGVTTEGRLIFSNDSGISPLSFEERPLVQSFFKDTYARFKLPFRNGKNQKYISGYFKIPDSNLVFFVEVNKADVFARINSTVIRAVIILLFISLIAVAVFQFPLQNIIVPIINLADVAEHIAVGNYQFKIALRGNGEIGRLAEAFKKMVDGIIKHEAEIRSLSEREINSLKLKNEIEVAQNIQNNLLPSKAIKPEGLNIEAVYRPASMCAGDWYFYHYDKDSASTIFVIADVSGHGVGASMFTAILAGLFNIHIERSQKKWDLEAFIADVNHTIFSLGKSHWHISLIVGIHNDLEKAIELRSCGHVPAYYSMPTLQGLQNRFIQAPSDLIGLSAQVHSAVVKIPFPSGSKLLLYTDGLTEAKDSSNKNFGMKNLARSFSKNQNEQHAFLEKFVSDWEAHCEGIPLNDDVCVLLLAAS